MSQKSMVPEQKELLNSIVTEHEGTAHGILLIRANGNANGKSKFAEEGRASPLKSVNEVCRWC